MIDVETVRLPAVTLRPALASDCERVWQWNFAPAVRAVSGDPTIVSIASHAAWYAKRLLEERGPIWVIEEHMRPVGVVRIDADDGRISIALDARARGRGIGKRAIAEACREWGGRVVANVRADNRASRSCFEACGFRVAGEHDGIVSYFLEG